MPYLCSFHLQQTSYATFSASIQPHSQAPPSLQFMCGESLGERLKLNRSYLQCCMVNFSTLVIQVYELCNAGDSLVEYRIDTQPLEVLRESNYFMSILECLQPSGAIPAGRTIPVQFVFSPLEAKRYTVGYICAQRQEAKDFAISQPHFCSQTVRLCMDVGHLLRMRVQ